MGNRFIVVHKLTSGKKSYAIDKGMVIVSHKKRKYVNISDGRTIPLSHGDVFYKNQCDSSKVDQLIKENVIESLEKVQYGK